MMKKYNFLSKATASIAVIGVTIFFAGCPHDRDGGRVQSTGENDKTYSHNLARVKCKKYNVGGSVDIEVDAIPEVLKDPNDRVVFVCDGEIVNWFTHNPNIKIKVDFNDKEKAVGLFESGITTLVSDQDHADGAKNQTVKQVIKGPSKKLVAYAYSIEIDDLKGNLLQRIDPHVIPMGK